MAFRPSPVKGWTRGRPGGQDRRRRPSAHQHARRPPRRPLRSSDPSAPPRTPLFLIAT